MQPLNRFLRLATYLPRKLWLSRVLKSSSDLEIRDRRVFVLLSCDTEFDPPTASGTWSNRSTRSLDDGLPRFLDLCDRYSASATLFCEGKLVETFADLFRNLADRHEIGCHSYAHEWLGTAAPLRTIPHSEELVILSAEAKARVIKHAVISITKAVGKIPRSFKAPFNSIDAPSAFTLLEQIGFHADSSLPCFDNKTFGRFRQAPTRHTSENNLWSEGKMHMVEVPYTINPRLPYPFDISESVMQSVARDIEFALENASIQCRLDSLSGRDFTVMHITTHPWEFSELRSRGEYGERMAKRLSKFLDELLAAYEVQFLTVGEFAERWENHYCASHSKNNS